MYNLSLEQFQIFYKRNFKKDLPELKRDGENIIETKRKGYTIKAKYIQESNLWNISLIY